MTVRVNGLELEYVESGTGVPVVFCHGSGSDMRYWEPQREAVAAHYRFVAFSQRFHGRRSRPATGDASAEAHTRDLVAIIRRLGPEPVHLVGFSSAIALRAAIQEPDLVRSLTIIEPNVPWLLEGDPEGEAVLAAWRSENARIAVEAGGDPERRARLWFELVNNVGPGAFDEQADLFRRMWLDNFGRSRPPAASPTAITCADLRTLTAPTLAVAGERGMPYSRAIIERVSACIQGSNLVVVPSATHFLSFQEPAAFNELLLGFLARH